MVGVDNLLRSAVSRQVELRYGTLVSMEFTVVYGTAMLRCSLEHLDGKICSLRRRNPSDQGRDTHANHE